MTYFRIAAFEKNFEKIAETNARNKAIGSDVRLAVNE